MCHAPENTLAAFEKAIEFGTYRIECDVRRSRDGQLILMHDATLERTTDGVGRVADRTLAELKELKAGGSEPIPTLREALACARGRCRLLIESKEPDIPLEIIRLIEEAGMEDDCTVSSFNEEVLRDVNAASDRIATAYFLTEPKPFDPCEVIERLGVSLLVVWPRAATPEAIAAAKHCGLHVRCGFADTLTYAETYELFCRLADMGVDEMASGRPDWMKRMAEEYNQSQVS